MKKLRFLVYIFILVITLYGCQPESFLEGYLTDSEKEDYFNASSFYFDDTQNFSVFASTYVSTSVTTGDVTESFELISNINAIINWPDATDDHQASGDIDTTLHVGNTGVSDETAYDYDSAIDGTFAVQDGYYYTDVLKDSRDLKIRTTRPIIDQEVARDLGYDIGNIDNQALAFLNTSIAQLYESVYHSDEDTYLIYFDRVAMDFDIFANYIQEFYGISDYNMAFLQAGNASVEMLAKVDGYRIRSLEFAITTIHPDDSINYYQLKFNRTAEEVEYPADLDNYTPQDSLQSSDHAANIRFHVGEDYPYYAYSVASNPDLYDLISTYEKPDYIIEGFYLDTTYTDRIDKIDFVDAETSLDLDIYVNYIPESEVLTLFTRLLNYDSYTLLNSSTQLTYYKDEDANYLDPGTSNNDALYQDTVLDETYHIYINDNQIFGLQTQSDTIDLNEIIDTWLNAGIPIITDDHYFSISYNLQSILISKAETNQFIIDIEGLSGSFKLQDVNQTETPNVFDLYEREEIENIISIDEGQYIYNDKLSLNAYTTDDIDLIVSSFFIGLLTTNNHYVPVYLEDIQHDINYIDEPGFQDITISIDSFNFAASVFFFDPDRPMVVMAGNDYEPVIFDWKYVSEATNFDIANAYIIDDKLQYEGYYSLNNGNRIIKDVSKFTTHTLVYPILEVAFPVDTTFIDASEIFLYGNYVLSTTDDNISFEIYDNYMHEIDHFDANQRIERFYMIEEQRKFEIVYDDKTDDIIISREVLYALPAYYSIINDLRIALHTTIPMSVEEAPSNPYRIISNKYVYSGYIYFKPRLVTLDFQMIELMYASNGLYNVNFTTDLGDKSVYWFTDTESTAQDMLLTVTQSNFDQLVSEGLLESIVIS